MANEQSGGNADKSKQQGGSGNFANDRQRASEAGKKGGQHSHGGQSEQSGSGRSQQSPVQSDDADEPSKSGTTSGTKDQR
jgi:hypothetical protein